MNENKVTYIQFHPRAQARAALLIGTLLTCGLMAPVWIIWEIVQASKGKVRQ